MGFFNPGLMWFAVGGAIPIIIHLLHRQKYRRVRWAAMEFLLAALKRTQRRMRLENLLLLLLRVLVMLLLALAISRPFLQASPLDMLGASDTHHILVIDTSYSMGFKKGAKSYLDQSREGANKLLESLTKNLSEQDKITVVFGSNYPEVYVPLANKIKHVKDAVAQIKTSHYGSNMYFTFQMVREILEGSRNPERRVYLFTDLQRNGWEPPDEVTIKRFDDLLKGLTKEDKNKKTKILLFNVAQKSQGEAIDDNRAVVGLRVSSDEVSTRRSTIFHADVYNWSGVSYPSVDVKFVIDGSHVGTASTPLPPNSLMTVTYRHEFNVPGPHFVEAAIDPDALSMDDHRYLALDVKQSIEVLIIDGEPESAPKYSCADYLKLMLAGQHNITGPVTPDMFTGEGLDKIDVVALCNVQALTQDKVAKLEEFVRRGGGLFVTLGGKVDRGSYNELLYKENMGLLPAELSSVGGMSPEIQPRVPLNIRSYNGAHAMFDWCTGVFTRAPYSLIFYQYYRLEKVDLERVLADLTDPANSPLLVEKKFGEGKVVLYTGTIDEEWSYDKLAGTPAFAAMIWELFPYLASRPLSAKNLAIGEPIQLAMRAYHYTRTFVLDTPGEGQVATSPEPPQENGDWFTIFYPGKPVRGKQDDGKPPTNEGLKFAGKYTLIRPKTGPEPENEERVVSYYACNLQPRTPSAEEIVSAEGNLDRISAEDLRKRYPDFKFELVGAAEKAKDDTTRTASNLWRYLLYLLCGALALESFLAWFFGRAKQ